ncbi:MAG: MATE family multidrug resistance protein, partial [Planctomycetota bacterium]
MARAPRVLKRKEVIRTTNMRAEFGRLFALAFPVAITQIGYMLFGVVDLLIVGRLDTESLSACVLGNSWIGGTMLIGIGIVSGMDPIISQAHGAANCQRLGRTL